MEPDSRFFRQQLSDEQWALVSDLFKPPKPSPKGGRPRADARACLEGVLWVLRSGARWKDLPPWFPEPTAASPVAVHALVMLIASRLWRLRGNSAYR
ncbi:MAG TPA: transposase [Lacipirellulaceae bacterium]|nr:transposase [Lacipirellulaceae bacterium]